MFRVFSVVVVAGAVIWSASVVAQPTTCYPTVIKADSHAVVPVYAPPYYYSVGDMYRDKALLRKIVKEELQELDSQRRAPTPSPAKKEGTRDVPKIQDKDAVDDSTPLELQKKVLAAFAGKGNCLTCHGNGQASGGFRLVDSEGRLLKKSSDKRWKIYGMASVGVMPPAAATDADKAMEAAFLPALLQYALEK
jgi:mono/diheme cytochrome c family protein